MKSRLALCAVVLTLSVPAVLPAQTAPLTVTWPTGETNPAEALVSLDDDDDDDDGVPDLAQSPLPVSDNEAVTVTVGNLPPGTPLGVATTGGLRVLAGATLSTAATVPSQNGRASVVLVGVSPSGGPRDSAVTFTVGGSNVRVAVTVASALFVHGDNRQVFAHRDALAPSHEVTNNDTLPRVSAWGDVSPDTDNLRVEVWDPGADHGTVRIESVGTGASLGVARNAVRGTLADLALAGLHEPAPLRTRFVRLVGDDVDLRAPGVQGQTLLVGLRDDVRVRYRRAGVAGEVTTDARVGRPGNDAGPLAARRARMRFLVLRDRLAAQGGIPVIGSDDAGALRIGRNQVAIANEIYLQCLITWGDPATAAVSVVDPPPPALLSVGDNDGYHAAGGEIRLRANGRAVGPVRTHPGWRPVDTAVAVADALRAQGFVPRVTVNPRTDYGDAGSADVLVRDRTGRLVTLTAEPGGRITTDIRQGAAIGSTDFTDGLDEFNNLNSSAGTLEERSLIKPLRADDLGVIDLFVVNRFARSTRIGEAFVEGDSGAILNALVLDRVGISAEREAWTQSHEIGHILLNQPWHPDNMGPDRPWLLMDADASLAAVSGPKRLTTEECARITVESGTAAVPSLLTPYDPVTVSPRATEFRTWPPMALYPRPAGVPTVTAPPAQTAPATPDRPARDYGITVGAG